MSDSVVTCSLDTLSMLMPRPRDVGILADSFAIARGMCYSLDGDGGTSVTTAVRRFVAWVSARVEFEIAAAPLADGAAALRIVCREAGASAPQLGEDESYELRVAATGIDLVARRPVGVIRGLATLQQLILASSAGGADEPSVRLGGVVIQDRPRFPWRGLMIDVSRHFMPVVVLERQIDAMALVKLNVLHLHLTDDQGFRIESRAFPGLHGAGSQGEFYTRAEIQRLVRYAGERGIRIVPEFDLPGHASSWLAGYPHLGCRPTEEYRVVETWNCVDVCMDPSNEQVYEFLEQFFVDVLPLFPDPFVHIGGDEVHGDEWRATPHIVTFMGEHGIADTLELQARFNARLHAMLARMGKRLVGWDEVAHPTIPTDAVVQSWRGAESVANVTGQGYACLRSHGYYLNSLSSAASHYGVDPAAASLPAVQAARVLGGEACMWTEFVDPDNLDSRVWPRMAAIAERFWSPRERCDARGLGGRLEQVGAMLACIGVRHTADLAEHLLELAGPRSPDALAIILGTLVPESLDAIVPSQETDRHTVLRRFRDVIPVVRPEFDRALALGVDYRDEGARCAVEIIVHGWRDAGASFELEFSGTPTLAELAPFVDRLRTLIGIVDAALASLRAGTTLDREWLAAGERCLEDVRAPHAGMMLGVIGPIRELMHAARSPGS